MVPGFRQHAHDPRPPSFTFLAAQDTACACVSLLVNDNPASIQGSEPRLYPIDPSDGARTDSTACVAAIITNMVLALHTGFAPVLIVRRGPIALGVLKLQPGQGANYLVIWGTFAIPMAPNLAV